MDNNTNSNIHGTVTGTETTGYFIHGTVTGTETTGYFNVQYCGFRLPCGYCTRLNQPCPMNGFSYGQPIWTNTGSGLENLNKCEVNC